MDNVVSFFIPPIFLEGFSSYQLIYFSIFLIQHIMSFINYSLHHVIEVFNATGEHRIDYIQIIFSSSSFFFFLSVLFFLVFNIVSLVAQLSLTLSPHELQHARVPCPSPTPKACSNSCALSR